MHMILNLTQHSATQEQIDAGVVDLPAEERQELARLLTFEAAELLRYSEQNQKEIVRARAREIVDRFVRPRVLENARAMLRDGGFVTDKVTAYNMLRPEVAARGIKAMIGGALWLMRPLIEELERIGVQPIFAVSDRESIEEKLPDGTVKKMAVFRHKGFVPAA